MTPVRIDESTAAALKEAEPGTELLGPDGRVGVFIPARLSFEIGRYLETRRRMIEEADAAVSVEELERSDAAGGEIPNEEVFRLLGIRP
jgi:hypothetical protein